LYLLYVDESGNPKNPHDNYFVLGAVAIYETRAFHLSRSIDEIQEKWFPESTEPIEFHAAEIFNRNCEPWRSLTKEQCRSILIEVCDAVCGVFEKGLYLFGVAVHKDSFPKDDSIEKAFYELCGHFDEFISQSNYELEKRERNRGLMVFDSSRYRGHLDQLLVQYMARGGTKYGRIKNFADAPAFADSKTTRLLQVADIVAYSIFRRYNAHDTLYFDRLLPRFQKAGTTIHGLMHLVSRWRDCPCPACMSRNLSRQD
jgi:hypothetical protein